MAKAALVILAAGIGSRFGGGIKQLTSFGKSGELIIDFSVYDALEAGFDKVVFLIRRDLEKDFRERIGDRISKICPVEYAYQETCDLPAPFECPESRVKPWGTGHALLCCRDVVSEPFAVINADDYYGKKAFCEMFRHLTENSGKGEGLDVSMSAFVLKNTLSENGGVTRGICALDDAGKLVSVTETYNIQKRPFGAVSVEDGIETPVNCESLVSMNFWGFAPGIFPVLEEGFKAFLEKNIHSPKAEYLLPNIVDGLIRAGRTEVCVLRSDDSWFGVTYKEDVPGVKAAFAELIDRGVYPEKLFTK